MLQKTAEESKGRVLMVDDDESLLRAYERTLLLAGYVVQTATSGRAALSLLDKDPSVDVVITDIHMPEMDGLCLLREIRGRNADLPVALVTAEPEVESAMDAVQLGALSYVPKPVDPDVLTKLVQRATRLYQFAKLRRQSHLAEGDLLQTSDRGALDSALTRALDGLWIAFQPIVHWSEKNVFGYEALLRTSSTELPHPGAILKAAERLDRLEELGRRVRSRVAECASGAPEGATFFVNLHARDLRDESLFSEGSPLSELAKHVVLEITERAALDEVPDMRKRIESLRKLGYRIAVDDLGAGYSGLSSLACLEPEIVKIDMSLVRGIDKSPAKLKLIHSILSLSRDLHFDVIAEGVETQDELGALCQAGCILFQGYLFARPTKHFETVSF